MSKHTPGPWRYDGRAYIWGPQTEMVAMLDDDDSQHVAMIRGTGANLPQDANARLIAAAPELLHACKAVLTWLRRLEEEIEPDDPWRGVREQIHAPYVQQQLEAAIRKAENGE